MQRKRGELVPIGDALSGMGGPVATEPKTQPIAAKTCSRSSSRRRYVGGSGLATTEGTRSPVCSNAEGRAHGAPGNAASPVPSPGREKPTKESHHGSNHVRRAARVHRL